MEICQKMQVSWLEKTSFIEGRISELENKISRAEVIDISSLDNSKIAFGATFR